MPNFKSIVENTQYRVGCTGQTVYVYDKNGAELGKFKDLIYAYTAAISPLGNIFVVKSQEGRLAVYSLETMSLLKKFRFSKVNYSQGDGCCFSPDGKYFLNVERRGDDLHSAISVYAVSDFSLVSRIFLGESMMIEHIQELDGEYYVLGFLRGDDWVITSPFVAKYKNSAICDVKRITNAEREFYWEHIYRTMFGWWQNDNKKPCIVHTLGKLWSFKE